MKAVLIPGDGIGKEISQSGNSEIYNGLLNITQQLADEKR